MKEAFQTRKEQWERDEEMPDDHELVAIPRHLVSELKEFLEERRAQKQNT